MSKQERTTFGRLHRRAAFARLSDVDHDRRDGGLVRLAVASPFAADAGEGVETVADGGARVVRMWRTLRRAMSRACPPHLFAIREDLVQDALLKVMERESAATSTVRSASYLWRVAFSVVADEIRRQRTRSDPAQRVDLPERVAEPSAGLSMAVGSCLATLDEPRRLAVTLHLQGFTAKEAGRLLGWNEKRVRNLIFRGMADLRHCLGPRGV